MKYFSVVECVYKLIHVMDNSKRVKLALYLIKHYAMKMYDN